MRILIVEDEAFLADAMRVELEAAAMAVDVVADGDTALERVAVNDYDVLVLDRDLPGVHGDNVCRHVCASERSLGILMVTAAGRSRDAVDGLALGADDYLVKPFDPDELVARVRSVARRNGAAASPDLARAGLVLDPHRREVRQDDVPITVTRKEFAVLEVLLRADGGVVSAERLLEKAWDENADPFTNSIRVTVSKLRKKLVDPRVIETLPGVGYRIRSR
jgi:two-component system response regulator VanR